MSRDANGTYTLPAGYLATTGQTIEATQHNDPLEDLQTDMNTARPVVAGGTGATTAAAARDNLEIDGKVQNKSAGYTALLTDRSTLIRCTASLTLDLTAAATLGDGWFVRVLADGGDVTVDPNGSETIDGSATLTIEDGESALIVCNGSNFFTDGLIALFDAKQAAIDLKAPIASPTFTGTPAAPTAANGTDTTQLATTAFVQNHGITQTTGSAPYYGLRAMATINGSASIQYEKNIASCTRSATGVFDVTFTTAAPNTTYFAVATADRGTQDAFCNITAKTTAGFQVRIRDQNANLLNPTSFSVLVAW